MQPILEVQNLSKKYGDFCIQQINGGQVRYFKEFPANVYEPELHLSYEQLHAARYCYENYPTSVSSLSTRPASA